eukprot:6062492-Pyramimonas_sp.AAC.1
MGRRCHVDPAAVAFGGAPYGATKRCTGCAETQTCGGQRQGWEKGGGRRGDAGRCLFKTRTQHHMLFEKNSNTDGEGVR